MRQAKGETVYWNAWGGSENVNDYIAWAGRQMEKRYGMRVVDVKVADTADAVAKVVAEKAAGKDRNGSVDLIWINGENFVAMKKRGLADAPGLGDEAAQLEICGHRQSHRHDRFQRARPTGWKARGARRSCVFFYDSARTKKAELPDSAKDLLVWAKAHPGRFSYPAPPDFIGSSFLKQVLYELIDDRSKLDRPVDEATFESDVAPLFAYLDELRPYLWRRGRAYPKDYPAMRQKLADGELGIIFAFNPSEASAAIEAGQLPDTVRSFTFSGGTIGNTHFVAIPFNASAKAAALVLANFLISPEAQLHKQNPEYWGDPTVLSMKKLPDGVPQEIRGLKLGVATLPPDRLGPVIPEPDASWTTRIEQEWKKRYGVAN